MSRVPLDIRTCESATDTQLTENILRNVAIIPEWLEENYRIHHGHALMISAGHSFTKRPKDALEEILNSPDRHPSTPDNHTIFTVKHALPYFENTEWRPDYCVVLDPRPIEGVSTLGHVRKDIYKLYPETTYLVASMTHHSVAEYLISQGMKVVGWHSMCAGVNDPRITALGVRNWIVGGSCSAMRGINVARVMGYREISLLGYDSNFTTEEAVYHLLKKRSAELTAALNEIDKARIPVDFNKMLEIKNSEMGPPIEHRMMLDFLNNNGYEIKIPGLKSSETLIPVIVNNFKSWISPEIAAQVKDIEALFQGNQDVLLHNLSGGFCKAIWDAMGGAEKINPPHFITP